METSRRIKRPIRITFSMFYREKKFKNFPLSKGGFVVQFLLPAGPKLACDPYIFCSVHHADTFMNKNSSTRIIYRVFKKNADRGGLASPRIEIN